MGYKKVQGCHYVYFLRKDVGLCICNIIYCCLYWTKSPSVILLIASCNSREQVYEMWNTVAVISKSSLLVYC